MKKLLRYIFPILCLVLIGNFQAKAQSSTVSAQVNDTTIIINGNAGPSSLITFRENSSIIGTTTSDANGSFSKTFGAVSNGIHTIDIWWSDANNLTSLPVQFNLFLIDHQVLQLDHVYLPPTISLNGVNFIEGDQIIISGFTKPNVQLEYLISGATNASALLSSNNDGSYLVQIPANSLPEGDYQVTTNLINIPIVINPTTSEIFAFHSSGQGPLAVPTNIVPDPTPACAYEYVRICFFDVQHNGYLEVSSDFSRYLNGFINDFNRGFNNAYDINSDGQIDVQDFSIVLYHTKGEIYQVTNLSPLVNGIATGKVQGISTEKTENISQIIHFFSQFVQLEIVIFIVVILLFVISLLFKKRNSHGN